jgi:hypothetical protein
LGAEVAVMASHIADIHFRKPAPCFRLWYGILIGPLAWMADQQISYSLVAHSCSTGHHDLLIGISTVSFLFALSGALTAAMNLARTREAKTDGGSTADRSRFMASLGVAASLGWATLIIAMAIPRMMLTPCD